MKRGIFKRDYSLRAVTPTPNAIQVDFEKDREIGRRDDFALDLENTRVFRSLQVDSLGKEKTQLHRSATEQQELNLQLELPDYLNSAFK